MQNLFEDKEAKLRNIARELIETVNAMLPAELEVGITTFTQDSATNIHCSWELMTTDEQKFPLTQPYLLENSGKAELIVIARQFMDEAKELYPDDFVQKCTVDRDANITVNLGRKITVKYEEDENNGKEAQNSKNQRL